MHVVGLDVGGSSVKAWVARLDGTLAGSATVRTAVIRPGPHRVEFDPQDWEQACRSALVKALERAGSVEVVGITVSSLRQGFVLLDRSGRVLGNGILNSDRRGADYTDVLAGRHALTGHWPAPELTMPKLLAVRAEEPDRWAATSRLLFVHDWLLWRLCGAQVTEVSYACAGAMADVARRGWAYDLLAENQIDRSLLAPIVEAGTLVGRLATDWPLPAGIPVVSGCGDTQLAAMSVGGLGDGVITVVAGSSTPVQVATAAPAVDPLGRPWVSTHADPGLWAAEGNAGYPGTFSGWWSDVAGAPMAAESGGVLAVTAVEHWSEQTWAVKPPWSLVGLQPSTTPGQVRRALLEAHAFSIRGNVQDLERALGRPATAVVVTGGAAADGQLPSLVAELLGRDVHVGADAGASPGGAVLVGRALGHELSAPGLSERVVPAGDPSAYEGIYQQWRATTAALRTVG